MFKRLNFKKVTRNLYRAKTKNIDGDPWLVELVFEDHYWWVVSGGQYQDRCRTLERAKAVAQTKW